MSDIVEIWKEVPGWPLYEVSNLGRVRTWKKGGGHLAEAPKIMRTQINAYGYQTVNLSHKNKARCLRVGRTVLLAFRGEPEGPRVECDHINNDRADDRLENLRWLPFDTNRGRKNDPKGEGHGMAKLTEDQVGEIRLLFATGECVNKTELSRRYGVSVTTVGSIILRQIWKETKHDPRLVERLIRQQGEDENGGK